MREKGFFIQITTLNNRLVYISSDKSLKECVRAASQYVRDMDHYSKVYRELRSMQGVFFGMFFRTTTPDAELEPKPIDVKTLPKHLVVKIKAYDLEWDQAPDFDELMPEAPTSAPSNKSTKTAA